MNSRDGIAVMQFGEMVEGQTAEVFVAPGDSYTRPVLNSVAGQIWEADRVIC